jgi:transcriptional regulator with XRE-family HTH domain
VNKRIKEIRKKLGLTQAEFAERIGSVQNTVTGYESGRRNPSNVVISSICREFNINEEWLRTGSGDMFSDEASSLSSELKDRFRLSDGAALLIEKFIKLKDSDREAVVNFLIDAAQDLAALDNSSLSPEALYEKSLGVAPRPASTASNITDGIGEEKEA